MAQKNQGFWQKIIKAVTYQDFEEKEPFILKELEEGDPLEGRKIPGVFNAGQKKEQAGDKKQSRKPVPLEEFKQYREEARKKFPLPCGQEDPDLTVSAFLETNEAMIRDLYCLPDNKDLLLRKFNLGTEPPLKAFAIYMQGLSDKMTIITSILQPLMLFASFAPKKTDEDIINYIMENLLPGQEITKVTKFTEIMDNVNNGDTALFFDGQTQALILDTKGWEHRPIGEPNVEKVVRGPHEGFSEVMRSNLALVRKNVRDNNMITEMFKLGERSRTDCAVIYLNNLANPNLVKEVRRRLKSIKVDYINDTGLLEQLIEDSPAFPIPTILSTERPDRVGTSLTEGKVAIIVDGSPFALIVPTSMYGLIHAAEDAYLHWPFGSFLRVIRIIAIFMSLLLPAVYVAVSYYHQEMIPTDLLLAIAGSREKVPFPTIVEVLMMEFSWELIREAGVRIPGVFGPTIGIIGALILGQAAVAANLVSPILIIVVAVTGLAGFVIPNYSLSFSFRILRFIYIIVGAASGLFGLGLLLFVQLLMTSSLKSFGVPFLAPLGPKTFRRGTDILDRPPYYDMAMRPDQLNMLDQERQPKVSRGWVKDDQEQEGDDA